MKRHDFDGASFVFGLFFLVMALVALVAGAGLFEVIRTVWPVALVALGLAMLFSSRSKQGG